MQFEEDQSVQEQKTSIRDANSLEDFDASSNSSPPKKELASGHQPYYNKNSNE